MVIKVIQSNPKDIWYSPFPFGYKALHTRSKMFGPLKKVTLLYAPVNRNLEPTPLKGSQNFNVNSTSNLGVAKIRAWWIFDIFFFWGGGGGPEWIFTLFCIGEGISLPNFLPDVGRLGQIFFTYKCMSVEWKILVCERASNVLLQSSRF